MAEKKNVEHKVATGAIKKYMEKMGYFGWTSYWGTIYYLDKDSLNSESIKKHELKHVEQMERDGKIKFTFKYLYYWWKVGYHNNPYEVEARKAEEE